MAGSIFLDSLKRCCKGHFQSQLEGVVQVDDISVPLKTLKIRVPRVLWISLIAQLVKNQPAMQETRIRFLGQGRSLGEGKGYPLQYSGLENSMDCIVHGVAKLGFQGCCGFP